MVEANYGFAVSPGVTVFPFFQYVDNPDQAKAVEARLVAEEDRPPFAGRIESIRSMADVLPSSQDDKLGVLGNIREDLTPRVMASLAPDHLRSQSRTASAQGRRADG